MRWDFNRAACYDTEDAALATLPQADPGRWLCFAYHLVPIGLDPDGRQTPVDLTNVFDYRLPPLPAATQAVPAEPVGYVKLGYDVVSVGLTMGFECSPLSWNGMAREIAVNPYCLVDKLADALAIARRFDTEQPEPGDYFVVAVSIRGADVPRFP